ncbi:MAG: tRNA (adenosine(37)-N6)-threonylcarbamoyltransferase complex ATPase subunit type 1 TsaE [Elusimicrobiota bacterium]|nr:tRNA (adenosine(37)-N6)-threonylcarbamoyltransferase complex ATPase subunit type 1 TsaE [Elusimicrobiota bacterium]
MAKKFKSKKKNSTSTSNKNIFYSKSADETINMAANLSHNLKGGDIICLLGDLGAGKTTFAKGLAKGLGIKKIIVSPTFVIMKEYSLKKGKFCHLDLYRINGNDFITSGLDQCLNENNICAIEWPEKIESSLPKKYTEIVISTHKNNSRKIEIKNHDFSD